MWIYKSTLPYAFMALCTETTLLLSVIDLDNETLETIVASQTLVGH
jgi:hypothetical protein